MMLLFKDGYRCTKKTEADRQNFGTKLRRELKSFTEQFLPHMEEEEEVCLYCGKYSKEHRYFKSSSSDIIQIINFSCFII